MKYLSILFPLLFSTLFLAQDIITKKSGDELEVKILKVNHSNVMYKKYNDIEGQTFIMDKVHIFMIKYEDGRKEVFEGEDKNEKGETLLRKGLRIGLHATPANMVDPNLLGGFRNSGLTISGGLDVYYYFTDNVAIKTGVIVNALPDFEHYRKDIPSGGYTEKVKESYVNFIGVPIKIAFATGGKIGFYLEIGTTVFFKQLQNNSFTYSETVILQDVVTGIHYSPTKLISVHAGPSFQFNFGRYMTGVQVGISFALPNTNLTSK